MTEIDPRPFLAIGTAFLAALLVSVSHKYPNVREMWSTVASVIMFGLVISMAGGVLDGVTYEYTLFYLTDTIGLTMRVDPAGMIFAALAALLWMPINFYSIGYMRNNHEAMQTGYFAAFALCMGSTMGIAMASNLLTFFIFYEILTISSYPLVLHERDQEALLASRKYLAYTLVSGQLFLAGTVGVYCISGTMDFRAGGFLSLDMASPWVLQLLFVLMIMAGSVKAAVMPLHGWLPAAMVAPTPVSALLHAVAVVKTGAFAVLRVLGFVF
jgi:multicomponent Na+:H+ antiporter subunit D